MDQSAGDTRDEQRIGYLEFNGMINSLLGFFEHRVQFRRLRYGPRKAVEYEADQDETSGIDEFKVSNA